MTPAGQSRSPDVQFDRLQFARTILRAEADALAVVADRIEESFLDLVASLSACRGRVAVSGVGKSADVGAKIVGTLNSTGTRAYLLDATKAVHGDLGTVHPDDVALLLSHSGESEELVRLLSPLKRLASRLLGITSRGESTLARMCDDVLVYGPVTEACPNALAPSTSTTVMMALGDAIALTLSRAKQFSATDFARFHPAGNLGRKLATVEQLMRKGDDLRIAPAKETVRTVFAQVRQSGRRSGAVMLVDDQGRLAGIFTDSDLARLFERHEDGAFDRPIRDVMTRQPMAVPATARLQDAVDLLRDKKISELPVIDSDGRPIGLLDITDTLGTDPAQGRPPLRVVR